MKILEIFKIQGFHWLPCEILTLLLFFCKFFSCRKALKVFNFQARGLFKRKPVVFPNPRGFPKNCICRQPPDQSSSVARPWPSATVLRRDSSYRLPHRPIKALLRRREETLVLQFLSFLPQIGTLAARSRQRFPPLQATARSGEQLYSSVVIPSSSSSTRACWGALVPPELAAPLRSTPTMARSILAVSDLPQPCRPLLRTPGEPALLPAHFSLFLSLQMLRPPCSTSGRRARVSPELLR